ncbi:MAG: hypothetical protein AB7R00_30405 [Kofleriaceae bacterium]
MSNAPLFVAIDSSALVTVSGGSSTKTKKQEPDKDDVPAWSNTLKRIVKGGGKPKTAEQQESEDRRNGWNAAHNALGFNFSKK